MAISLLAGCGRTTNPPSPPSSPPPPPGPAVTWVESDIEHEGATIALGHRGGDVPVAAIVRDGKPVANAMVFFTPLTHEGEAADDEVAAIYEPASGKDPALYTTHSWQRPASGPAPVRFRIVLPDAAEDFTREIEIAQ